MSDISLRTPKASSLIFLALTVSLAVGGFETGVAAAQSQIRESPLKIQVVFVGFSGEDISLEYLDWNNPPYKHQTIRIPGIGTNVVFKFDYIYKFASQSFESRFVEFLNSIAVEERALNQMWNTSIKLTRSGLSVNYTTFEADALNVFYDADAVEGWLADHIGEVGVDADKYTLVVTDLHKVIPSATPNQFDTALSGERVLLTPHFYNVTLVDRDLNYRSNRKWMTAWGGRNRLYFIDLSAGPSQVTKELPIQLSAHANRLDVDSRYYGNWLTQYLSDYMYGVVQNLFAPDLLYPTNYAETYKVDILLLDNRSDPTPRLENTLDTTMVKESLKELLPFAEVKVEARFMTLDDYPELKRVVQASTSQSRGVQTGFPPDPMYPPNFVDARPVYQWLSEEGEGNLEDLFDVTRTEREYDIPVIVFAFQRDFNLAFTFKDLIAGGTEDIWGVALYDLALISHSEYELRIGDYATTSGADQPGRGFGFTQTVIHEVGHMLGLNHPFIYDPVEDFIASVMAYYPNVYRFSKFDIDTLLRAFTDNFLSYAESTTAKAKPNPLTSRIVSSVEDKIHEAESFYGDMDYLNAFKSAAEARIEASKLQYIPSGVPVIGWIGAAVIAAGVSGFALGYWMHRRSVRRTSICPYCRSSLTWMDEYERYYCQQCEQYV